MEWYKSIASHAVTALIGFVVGAQTNHMMHKKILAQNETKMTLTHDMLHWMSDQFEAVERGEIDEKAVEKAYIEKMKFFEIAFEES